MLAASAPLGAVGPAYCCCPRLLTSGGVSPTADFVWRSVHPPGAEVLEQILRAVLSRRPTCGTVRVLAVDGGAAAGKTTLAQRLAETRPGGPARADLQGRVVVHTDDLLAGWDDQFDFWPRLRSGVLDRLASGRRASYERYDWVLGKFRARAGFDPPELLIVEGVSAIEACGGYLTFGLMLSLPRVERERRWRARDGNLDQNAVRWLDREDAYFARRSGPAPSEVGGTDQAGLRA
jgi:hypothetical protein